MRLSRRTTASSAPFLSHQTPRREIYDEELAAARREGFFEVLFTNERGELTEGAFTNIFLRTKGLLLTPPLEAGLLDGVLRRRILDDPEEKAIEQTLYPCDLRKSDEVLVGNSVRGLLPVLAAPEEPAAGRSLEGPKELQ